MGFTSGLFIVICDSILRSIIMQEERTEPTILKHSKSMELFQIEHSPEERWIHSFCILGNGLVVGGCVDAAGCLVERVRSSCSQSVKLKILIIVSIYRFARPITEWLCNIVFGFSRCLSSSTRQPTHPSVLVSALCVCVPGSSRRRLGSLPQDVGEMRDIKQ